MASGAEISGECERWGIGGLAVGLSLGGPVRAGDWQRQLDWAARAEAAGAHSVWLPEMHFADGASPAPLLGLAALASRTQRLRLGTSSLLLPIHPPRRIAETAATLDRLSGGRLLLGLGRGFRAGLFQAFGVDAGSKRNRFDAHLDEILSCWSGTSDAGADSHFEPLQRPHPPLAVAAFGRKGLLQAASRGLPYLASPMEPLSQLAENVSFHREHRRQPIPPAPVVPVMRAVHVAANETEAGRVLAAMEEESRRMRGGSGRLPKALARAAAAPVHERCIIGTASAVGDTLAHYRESLGMNLLIARTQLAGASESEQHASFERLLEAGAAH